MAKNGRRRCMSRHENTDRAAPARAAVPGGLPAPTNSRRQSRLRWMWPPPTPARDKLVEDRGAKTLATATAFVAQKGFHHHARGAPR